MKVNKKNILWDKWYKKIIWMVAFIGGLAFFLNNIQAITSFFSKVFHKKEIHFVDITVKEDNKINLFRDTIDIKIRNNGENITVLKKIILDIKKSWTFAPVGLNPAGALIPTASYDLNIDTDKPTPYKLELEISQEVQPNKADRFF